MTEHLPECHLFLEPMLSAQDWCICDKIRACYQRGLDDAREAVAEFAPSVWIGLIKRSDAVLVIDALRMDAQ